MLINLICNNIAKDINFCSFIISVRDRRVPRIAFAEKKANIIRPTQTNLVRDRMSTVSDHTILVRDRISTVRNHTILVRDRMSTVRDYTILVRDRMSAVRDSTNLVCERISAVRHHTILVRERMSTVRDSTNLVCERISAVRLTSSLYQNSTRGKKNGRIKFARPGYSFILSASCLESKISVI